MKNARWICVAVGALLASYGLASADVTLELVDNQGNAKSGNVFPGSNFDVIVQVTTDTSLSAAQARLRDVSSSGYITFLALDIAEPIWDDNPSVVVDPTPEALDAGNAYTSSYFAAIAGDLTLPEPVPGTGIGTFAFATLTLNVSAAAPLGTYDLALVDVLVGDDFFVNIPVTAGSDYQVNVVPIPAPGAALLGVVGVGLLASLRRRLA